jgi:hypothetical protein
MRRVYRGGPPLYPMKTDTLDAHPALAAKLAAACLPDDGVQRTLPEALAKLAEIKADIVADYFASIS